MDKGENDIKKKYCIGLASMILSLIIFKYGWKLFKSWCHISCWLESRLFISYNDQEEVEEMVKGADNEEKVDIEVVYDKINEPIDDNFSLAFVGSDDDEEEKKKILKTVSSYKNRKGRKWIN